MPSLYRKAGALELPLSDTDATDFSSLDPARDILLELLFAAVNDELGPRWSDAVAGTSVTSSTPIRADSRFPFEPSQDRLQQLKTGFPALFVYRDGSPIREDEHTLWQRRYTSRWGADYFLGPLDLGNQGKLGDILVAVGKVISLVLRNGGHKAYATQAQSPSGATSAKKVLGPWGAGCCGFSSVQLVEFQAGPAALSKDSLKYWACSAVIETTELDGFVDGQYPNAFSGVTSTFGTGNSDGVITNISQVSTDSADEIWPDAL